MYVDCTLRTIQLDQINSQSRISVNDQCLKIYT